MGGSWEAARPCRGEQKVFRWCPGRGDSALELLERSLLFPPLFPIISPSLLFLPIYPPPLPAFWISWGKQFIPNKGSPCDALPHYRSKATRPSGQEFSKPESPKKYFCPSFSKIFRSCMYLGVLMYYLIWARNKFGEFYYSYSKIYWWRRY